MFHGQPLRYAKPANTQVTKYKAYDPSHACRIANMFWTYFDSPELTNGKYVALQKPMICCEMG